MSAGSFSRPTDVPPVLRARAAEVRLAIFDVDGTLTDGTLSYDDAGRESKAFHVHDGLGLKLLMSRGIAVALVTARHGRTLEGRAAELGIVHLRQGVEDKRASLLALCAEIGIDPRQCAWMGDDLPDLPAMRLVGLAAAPADAHPWIAERAHWCAHRPGGRGAARELCDLLLAAGGHLDDLLAQTP